MAALTRLLVVDIMVKNWKVGASSFFTSENEEYLNMFLKERFAAEANLVKTAISSITHRVDNNGIDFVRVEFIEENLSETMKNGLANMVNVFDFSKSSLYKFLVHYGAAPILLTHVSGRVSLALLLKNETVEIVESDTSKILYDAIRQHVEKLKI